MMSLRRWASAGVVASLCWGVTLQPVPAQAVMRAATMDYADGGSVSGDPGCAGYGDTFMSSLSGPRARNAAFPTDGSWHTRKLDRTGTLGAREIRAGSTVSARAVSNSWGTTRLGLKVRTNITAKPTSSTPSACRVSYAVDGAARGVDVTVRGTSWLAIRSTVTSTGRFASQFGAVRADDAVQVIVPAGGSRTQLVPGGTYHVGGGTSSSVEIEARNTVPQAARSDVEATVNVFPIGTLRKDRGKALRFLRPGHRDCAEKRVRVKIRNSLARRATRVTFFVNGEQRKVLSGKKLRRNRVALKQIRPRSDGAIRAVVVRKSGEIAKMSAESWPCKA